MKKFLIAATVGGLLGIAIAPQLAGPLLASETDQAKTYKQLELFGDIFDRIRAKYVEDVDDAKLIEAAINGMLTSLDPHSSYLSPNDTDDMRIQTRGAFGGLGIEVTQEDGFVKVIAPIDETPAAEAGVEPGRRCRVGLMELRRCTSRMLRRPNLWGRLSLDRPAASFVTQA